jgi:hypothetical protein
LVQKLDAAYHYGQPTLTCGPAPALGPTAPASMGYVMQHSAVQTFEAYRATVLWGLNANTSYSGNAVLAFSGGSWQYNQGPDVLWIESKAWPR